MTLASLDAAISDARAFPSARRARRRVSVFQRGRVLKRAIDICGALAGLFLAAPLMTAIFIVLAFEPGSPLFAQTRVGRGGRRFRCLKFRTMTTTAEAELAPILAGPFGADWRRRQKLARDPRVTVTGAVLRRWGLDELPQLLNVLCGEMSLVGPRPVIPPETPGYPADRAYAESPAFAAYRTVRPGLTGLWQVSGGAETTHARRVSLDQDYVAGWSLALDLRILLATPRALALRRHG